MVTVATWQQKLSEHPDRPQGRQRLQLGALLALAGLLNRTTGKGAASLADIAKAAGIGERTVYRATAWAKANGWLSQKRGHGHKASAGYADAAASEWALLLPEQPANWAEQPASSTEQPASSSEQPASSTKPAPRPASRKGKRSQPQGRRCSNGFSIGLVDGIATCCPDHDFT